MKYELPKEELEFFVNFGKKQGAKPTFISLIEKLDGIDIIEMKKIFSEIEEDINNQIDEEKIERIKNIDDPEEFKNYLEELSQKIPTKKYESRMNKVKKAMNKVLLRESINRIMKESYDELKEAEKKVLKNYGHYPGDLTFLWFYYSENVYKSMEHVVRLSAVYTKNPRGIRNSTIDRFMSETRTMNFNISYGFMRLSVVTSKLLEGPVEESEILDLEREIFDLTSKISSQMTYDSLGEREQNLVSAFVTA